MSPLEIGSNAVNGLSIFLAGRNSVHTWWTGIIGCVLFGLLFYGQKLHADATLQVFFIATSAIGWHAWLAGDDGAQRPIRRTPAGHLFVFATAAVAVAMGYGWLLHRFTDAWSPFWDSMVLAFSVLAQLLLMSRRIETWAGWLIVNSIAVPLFWSRGLHLTSAIYGIFWLNAVVSFVHWSRLMRNGKSS
jgi:nicotinamide mononucleotide transporter